MFNFLKKIKDKCMSCCCKNKQSASGTSSNMTSGTLNGKSMDKQTSKSTGKQTDKNNTKQTNESIKKVSESQADSQTKNSASDSSSSQTSKDTHDKKQSANTSVCFADDGKSKNTHGKNQSSSDKKKTSAALQKGNEFIGAPLEGEVVSIKKVNDPTFSQEMLGKGVAILPSIGKVFSPVNGKISMIFDTRHALTITSDKGAEVLIHVGLDTVTLKGKPFTAHAKQNDIVKKGDLLLEFDMEAIKAAGLDTITPVVICNSDEYKEIIRYTDKIVNTGTTVMELVKK